MMQVGVVVGAALADATASLLMVPGRVAACFVMWLTSRCLRCCPGLIGSPRGTCRNLFLKNPQSVLSRL